MSAGDRDRCTRCDASGDFGGIQLCPDCSALAEGAVVLGRLREAAAAGRAATFQATDLRDLVEVLDELVTAGRAALTWEDEDEFGAVVPEDLCTPAYRAMRARLRAAIARATVRR